LVPRPETEHWVQHLSQVLLESSSSLSKTTNSKGKFRILDIGTGSGCIALGLTRSLMNARSGTIVETIGIDQSEEAVELARENTVRCSLENEVRIEKMDLFEEGFGDEVMKYQEEGEEEGGKGFDLIVSNPPYITREEFEGLDKSVKNWEDRKALVGESPLTTTREDKGMDDGLIFYRRITSLLPSLLRDSLTNTKGGGGPVVAFEVGKGQAREVGGLLRREGFKSEIVSDPWGVERAVFGWRR